MEKIKNVLLQLSSKRWQSNDWWNRATKVCRGSLDVRILLVSLFNARRTESRRTERPAVQFGCTELTCRPKSVHSPNYLSWLQSNRATKEARHFVIVELSWLCKIVHSPVDFSRLESDRAVRKPLVHLDNYLTQPWCLFDCKVRPTFGSWVGLHDYDN